MKKIKRLPLIIYSLLIILTAVALLFSHGGGAKAYAAGAYDSYDPYDYQFDKYHITYDIRADRTMDVCVDMDVHYLGYESTGLLYDIPVNAGDRVRHIEAYTLDANGKESHLVYKVKQDIANFITVDMGDYSKKTGEVHSYRLKYEYAITKPAKSEKNILFLNAVGGGFNQMSDVLITLNLSDGFIPDQIKRFKSESGSEETVDDWELNGNTITLSLDYLSAKSHVTFEIGYESGVLSTKPDLTPYWVIIVACVILALLFAAKFLLFNKDGLTPVVNVEAPNDMDPLVMGKLIDNKVDKSDVTSLIYYWANKGYIKINMPEEKNADSGDIELIQIRTRLPEGSPSYQVRMYDKLFKSGSLVKISDLTYKFYPTVESVTKEVNAQNSKLYSGKSMAFAVLFAIIGGLVMALTPMVLALTTISAKLFLIAPLVMIAPAIVIFALTITVRYNRLKFKKPKLILCYVGVALLAAVFGVIYVLALPSYYVEVVPKIILCIVGFAIVMLSACIVSRTEKYTEKLNQIVGFREFITLTEKDKLEVMLEENPELYYQVLPYAIVLGVSDIWENKFAKLTIAPPSWTTRSYSDRVFDFMIFNAAMWRVNTRMTSSFVSRPQSSPSSGSFSGGGSHGGHFGGFSGGGHGGGGARGR